ncbi:SGNH/GDSL hydrolase family protein [Actinokineospora inagensis]|uniref:SGNH/GDSL hydrolase family protein n=1 Tax=Actinokineospora inagensis TaxID=103730 RepID=UPI0003F8BF41|nr:SGNH/GDSL hydrolase family protein [Actinokineospora inagensis]
MYRIRALWVAALAAGSVGGLSGAAYSLLQSQSRHARLLIGAPRDQPFNADGGYLPDGTGPVAVGDALTFAVFGDSSAAGLGAETPELLPGVLLARGLAEEMTTPVRLTTYAVSGSRTTDLAAQVDRALLDPPRVALVMVGGNDVTARRGVHVCAGLLAAEVRRLVAAGTRVVVGTCPDLGTVEPIPQPLRALARRWSLALGRAQARALAGSGAAVVPLTLLARHFQTRPRELFSPDRFHPNGTGYALAAAVLLAPLCRAAGLWNSAVTPG